MQKNRNVKIEVKLMFKNYLNTALRFLRRNKLFAGINLLGLSLALAASFIILLYVINEVSYNRNYKNREQIFRVLDDSEGSKSARTPYVLASALKDYVPQVEIAVTTASLGDFKLKLKDEFISIPLTIGTNSELFNIFDLSLSGSSENILEEPNSIVLSQKQADKFFHDENPIGKEITGLVNDNEQIFIVKGVFKDIPLNSSLKADCFVSSKWTLDRINKIFNTKDADLSWRRNFWTNWVMLKRNVDTGAVDSLLKTNNKQLSDYSLQNLSDVYFHSEGLINAGETGNIKAIRLFLAIAFLIILVAAINYIILSTAVSSERTKEIGIRKTNGASIGSLRKQLLSESLFLAFLAFPVALLLVKTSIPYAEKLFQIKLQIINSNVIIYILVYLSLIFFIGLVSGLYTSSYLSRINVISIMNNSIHSGKQKSSARFALIVIQLIIFCSFMSATLLIRSQFKFAMEKDLGYHSKNILLVKIGSDLKNAGVFINSIKSLPNVIDAAGASEPLPMLGSSWSMIQSFRNSEQVKIESMDVDYGYLEVMGMTIVKGRGFSKEFGSDLKNSLIFNETAIKQLGIEDPVGKFVIDRGQTIIGVVKDFNLHSIHTEIPPIKITLTDKYIEQVSIQYDPGSLNNLLPQIENEWKKAAPGVPFDYLTIEEFMEKYIYSSEKSLSAIFSIFALFSLIIATVGLFGLTLFIAKTRTKEIGIKRILGSSEKSIVFSFVRNNLIMVLIASSLSIPITFYFINMWLSSFAYKVNISWWVFVFTFLVASIVVLLTVLFHSFRVARINPVESLRYE
jgi:putative ABC transport system permease protein